MARDIYVALGDSITAGYDATHPAHTFVHQFYTVIRRRQLAQRTTVIAQNGWDTQTLQRAVQSSWPKLWDEVSLATVLIGGNDLRKLLTRQFLSGT
ncbi:MAG: SGNH/GDSL hydrolase family protein, partial [Firmicutes bacterium]|nr:SGNH/GDSL hydrolase family protein [Bacillota bacterium]